MRVEASTLRGCGIEYVSAACKVAPETLRVTRDMRQIEIGHTASISLRELGVIIEFLREKGIVLDPDGEKQRRKLQTKQVIKLMAERGWLTDEARKVWQLNAA